MSALNKYNEYIIQYVFICPILYFIPLPHTRLTDHFRFNYALQTSIAAPPLTSVATALLLDELNVSISVRQFWHSTAAAKIPSTFLQTCGEANSAVDTRVSFIWGSGVDSQATIQVYNVS